MGISVRMQNSPKPVEIVTAQVSLEKDLRNCMRCRYFYGNNSQCLAKNCIREETGKEAGPNIMERSDKDDLCFDCPYKQSERYCFPCMRKILKGNKKDGI